jgi:hypothetical protein
VLSDVTFNDRIKRLSETDVDYNIKFVTTNKSSSNRHVVKSMAAPLKQSARDIPLYSDDAGKTINIVDGSETLYPGSKQLDVTL